jgi:hypothetical protein
LVDRPVFVPLGLHQFAEMTKGVPGIQVAICLFLLPALMLSGCEKQEKVVAYTVAKPPPAVKPASIRAAVNNPVEPKAATAGEMGRILGAIVPHGEKTWFFKLTGPTRAVVEQVAPFLDFIRSLRFEGEAPRWTVPEGWTEQPGNQFRFATIVIAGASGPLELTVSPLPTGDGDFETNLLANINRWRGQMQVAPIEPAQLEKSTMKLDVGDLKVWLVNIEGRLGGGMGGGPATGGPTAKTPQKNADSPRELPPLPFAFTLPEGWTRKPAGPMRLAEFEVKDGEQRVTISASTAGGDLLANINRWRGQVGLDSVPDDKLRESLRKIEVGKLTGDYAELVGPETTKPAQTILGVIVQVADRQWFFKLQGDGELAQREQSRFEEFVKSIQFNK